MLASKVQNALTQCVILAKWMEMGNMIPELPSIALYLPLLYRLPLLRFDSSTPKELNNINWFNIQAKQSTFDAHCHAQEALEVLLHRFWLATAWTNSTLSDNVTIFHNFWFTNYFCLISCYIFSSRVIHIWHNIRNKILIKPFYKTQPQKHPRSLLGPMLSSGRWCFGGEWLVTHKHLMTFK